MGKKRKRTDAPASIASQPSRDEEELACAIEVCEPPGPLSVNLVLKRNDLASTKYAFYVAYQTKWPDHRFGMFAVGVWYAYGVLVLALMLTAADI